MFNVKDLVIEKIISCNVCDADGKIIGKTTRPLDDDPICHDYKSNNNIIKKIDKNQQEILVSWLVTKTIQYSVQAK